ncbi:SPOR domain-containing protein [Acidihalobacter prosperus]
MAPRNHKTSKPRRRSSRKASTPGWAWLSLGLAIGLFAGFLFYLSYRPATSHHNVLKQFEFASQQAKHQEGTHAQKRGKPKFDFYTLLPKLRVQVPKPSVQQATRSHGKKPAASHVSPQKVTSPGKYLLQVASFGTQGQANVLKAKLAFQGIVASVAPTKVKHYTWYRVQVGPFNNLHRLNQMIDKLAKQHLKPLVIKEKS